MSRARTVTAASSAVRPGGGTPKPARGTLGTAMECMDDNLVVAFIERLLPEPERRGIQKHLDSCELCLAITCAAARQSGALPEAVPEPTRGALVGRYALIEMIGRGAMGSVFVAHDPQLDRRIALKIVRSDRFVQPEVRARMSREARAMAQVKHPHVVTVYDAGELEDGVFLAMELVDGDTLTRWLAERVRTWSEIVRMFVAAGRGLSAAHAAGIVHRDFKPENVLVDRGGRAAVTDFGLSLPHVVPPPPAPDHDLILVEEAAELTRTGVLLGTPRYMAPEQFRGDAVDARTDQFGFAVALYEALYRKLPYAGATVGELRAAVTAGVLPARPTTGGVPARAHAALARALAPRREDRFASMDDLLAQLERSLRPVGRRRAYVSGLVVAGLAIATSMVVLRGGEPSAPAPQAAQAPPEVIVGTPGRTPILVGRFRNATGDPRLDDTLDVAVAGVLSRSTRIDPLAGVELADLASQLDADPSAVDEIAAKLAAHDPRSTIVVRGAVEQSDAGYVLRLDARDQTAVHPRFTSSEPAASLDEVLPATLRLAARLREELGDPPATGTVDHVLSPSLDAVHAWMAGQRKAVAGDLAGAVIAYRRALTADPDFADARAALGLVLYNLSDREAAATELERALQGSERMAERQRLTLLGDHYGATGNYAEAISAYQQLLVKWPGDARTQINVTATAIDAGSFALALELARDAAKRHPNLGIVRANQLLAELATGRLDDAARTGAAMLAEVPRPTGFGHVFLAMTHALRGDAGAAQAIYDRLAALEPALADDGRADLALYRGRLSEAEGLLRASIDAAIARETPAEARTQLLTLARLKLRRGDRPGAVEAATRASDDVNVRVAYLAASVMIEAGNTRGVAAKIRTWSEHPLVDWRLFGTLLQGDLARAQGRPRDALVSYRAAGRIGATWWTHERLGRAYLDARAWADAERELAWCVEHGGEAAVFMSPSLSLLPEVYLNLARSKDRGAAPRSEVVAAYQAVLDLGATAEADPVTEEARRRLAALTR